MGPSTLQKLSVVCLISTTVPAASALSAAVNAAQAIGLLPRAEVCGGDDSLSQCGSSFPSSFCCPSDTTCTSIGDNSTSTEATTVICCPTGSSCQYIEPITCDISQQNATAHPSNAIHTTNLTATLTTCGTECCPLGYECENGLCSMVSSSSSSSSSSASSTVPSSTSVVSLPAAASTTAAATSSSSSTAAASSSKHSNSGAVAGGVIGGIALGVLLTFLVIWLLKRRKNAKKETRYSGDFGPVSRTVSDPIYNPSLSGRSDFLRRDAASPNGSQSIGTTLGLSSPFSMKEGNMRRQNTVASSIQKTPQHGYGYGMASGPGGGMAAKSPEQTKSPLAPLPRIKSLFSRSSLHLPRPASSMYSRATATPYTPTPAQRRRAPEMSEVPPVPPIRSLSTTKRSPQRSTSQRTDSSTARLNGPSNSRSNRESRPQTARTGSTETIDVLMPAPTFISTPPPVAALNKGPGQQHNSFLQPPPPIGGAQHSRWPSSLDGPSTSRDGQPQRPLTGQTTFSQLMENAGFSRDSAHGLKTFGSPPVPAGPSRSQSHGFSRKAVGGGSQKGKGKFQEADMRDSPARFL